MAQSNEIVLDVRINTGEVAQKLGDATRQVQLLKQEQKLLDKALEEGTITTEDYGKAIAESKAELEKANREVKASTALLQAETMARVDDNASLDEQRQALNAAQKAYGLLSGEQKKAADQAGGLRDQIKALSDRVKEQESAMGDNRRSVGGYAEGIMQAAGKMGGFGSSLSGVVGPIKNVTMGLRAMSATPIIAILGALITIIQKLAERFKNNAAAMEQLTKVFGVFSGAANIVNVIIDKIAEGLGWLAEKALEMADKLGLLTASMKEGQAIAEEDLAIQKEQQRVALANAESQNKIAKLRADAAEKDKKTAKERLDLLQQAANEEEAIAKRQYDLAKREYELQKRKNAQSASSMDDLKKENDLRIAMINAETTLFNKQKELNTQMATIREQMSKQGADAMTTDLKALEEQARKLEAIREELVRRSRTELQNEIADLEAKRDAEIMTAGLTADELLAIEDYYAAEIKKRQDEAAKQEYEAEVAKEEARRMAREEFGLDPEKTPEEQELERLQAAHEQELVSDEEFEIAKTNIQAKYAAERKKLIEDEVAKSTQELTQAYVTGLTGLKSVLDTLSTAFEELGDDSEESKKMSRAFAWVSLLTSQAIAVANTVRAITEAIANAQQSAAATGPAAVFTAPAFIAEMVAITAGATASAISGIVQAKQLISQSQGFATGGVVGGESYTGDNVLIRANSGEGVYTGKQANNLLQEIANNPARGGLDIEAMSNAFARAVAAQPAPVVAYTELQEFGDKVATYKEIASI